MNDSSHNNILIESVKVQETIVYTQDGISCFKLFIIISITLTLI